MSSAGGFWVEGNADDKPYSAWIAHRHPDLVANTYSVEQFWRDNLATTQKMGEKSEDAGCRKIKSYAFRCDRTTVGASGRPAAEAMFWNSQSDLVVIRVMTAKSMQDASAILDKIELKIDDHLPARKGT